MRMYLATFSALRQLQVLLHKLVSPAPVPSRSNWSIGLRNPSIANRRDFHYISDPARQSFYGVSCTCLNLWSEDSRSSLVSSIWIYADADRPDSGFGDTIELGSRSTPRSPSLFTEMHALFFGYRSFAPQVSTPQGAEMIGSSTLKYALRV
ncbi:hypothetical protein K474DRAFT_1438090 [Panus rudis PR-1116 ss-1]|nr:hypothetical protein K474DRAFT_1438090 [Panus rudis PR-1116 ss-1]